MSRASASTSSSLKAKNELKDLHCKLAHPGVTRMLHFVRSKNLSFSVEDVRTMVSNCSTCCKVKPQFYRDPIDKHLIKATHPFDRLNVDFKGPLPSSPDSKNKYILNIVDEYSRFPFAFACPDMKWTTVQACFYQLFAVFGMPSYVHSDRGPSFLCQELKDFLHSHGIATSRTSPYNPRGNGQIERYNATLWKAISLKIQDAGLDAKHWEKFLPDALHSIRSLLCTATNATPHERLFTYNRRTSTGCTLPVWLTKPGTVLLKRHVRASKYDPLVEEADLLEANPNYAHIRLKSGVEKTVSLRDLAPAGQTDSTQIPEPLKAKIPVLCIKKSSMDNGVADHGVADHVDATTTEIGQAVEVNDNKVQSYVTRYGRECKPVQRFNCG